MFHSPQERVANGAKLLDRYNPGWRDQINPDILNIADGEHCVIGQLHGDFNRTYKMYDLTMPDTISHGFFVPGDQESREARVEYNLLTAAWVEELTHDKIAA